MKKLLDKIWYYSLDDVINIEQSDLQYKSLQKLNSFYSDKAIYFALVLCNSIVCYQLSWSWEDYWEEFFLYFSKNIVKEDIVSNMIWFLKNCKNNKRLLEVKINRLKKIEERFLENFKNNYKYYYYNLSLLRDELNKVFNQNKKAKTIVFACKMFNYAWRNIFWFKKAPYDIFLPIDSRLKNIFEKYKEDYSSIEKFYFDLSQKLAIPMLHLDALLWVNYKSIMD